MADPKRAAEVHWASDGDMVRTAYALRPEDDDWGQAGTLVREVLDDDARDRLADNIIGHVSDGVKEPVLSRVFEYWTQRRPRPRQEGRGGRAGRQRLTLHRRSRRRTAVVRREPWDRMAARHAGESICDSPGVCGTIENFGEHVATSRFVTMSYP